MQKYGQPALSLPVDFGEEAFAQMHSFIVGGFFRVNFSSGFPGSVILLISCSTGSSLKQGLQRGSRRGGGEAVGLLGVAKPCSASETLTQLRCFEHTSQGPSSSSFPLIASPCAFQLEVFIFKIRLLAIAAAAAVTVTPAPGSAGPLLSVLWVAFCEAKQPIYAPRLLLSPFANCRTH